MLDQKGEERYVSDSTIGRGTHYSDGEELEELKGRHRSTIERAAIERWPRIYLMMKKMHWPIAQTGDSFKQGDTQDEEQTDKEREIAYEQEDDH